MPKPESKMRQDVHKAIRKLDPVAIENDVYRGGQIGYPDTNYIGGEIELKRLPEWPKRAATPVRIPHYKPHQRVFLYRRWLRGGSCWLLLRVEATDEWLLFTGEQALKVGRVSRQALLDNCHKYWEKGLDKTELHDILKAGRYGTKLYSIN